MTAGHIASHTEMLIGLARLTIHFAFPRARGGAEHGGESGPSFGLRRRRFLFCFFEGGERHRRGVGAMG